MQKLKLIVGLGNLGKQYADTRHNVGFKVLDRLAALYRVQFSEHNNLGNYVVLNAHNVVLAKPNTFMNNSGKFVKWATQKWAIVPGDVMIVHDELAFILGVVRFKIQGTANNHNGVKSVISHLNTEQFNRLRFGIKSENTKAILHDQVMAKFTRAELNLLEAGITKSVQALKSWIDDGITMANLMNIYNV